MRKIEQSVFPLWAELTQKYGMDKAFEHFGPYVGANIKVTSIDRYTVESSMELVETNTNYVGTHFGGSLYSMCDPFFMFLLMRNLGDEYIVWDKAAQIQFIKPGTGRVSAMFHITPEEITEIKELVGRVRKTDRIFECEVKNADGTVVASMKKTLYIRKMK